MTENRKYPERWKRRLPILIVAGLVAAGLLISLFRDMGFVDTWRLRSRERQLLSEVEKLRQENARLKQEMDDLRSTPAVIEGEARKLGLIKDREEVIVGPRPQDAPALPPAKAGTARPEGSGLWMGVLIKRGDCGSGVRYSHRGRNWCYHKMQRS